MDAIKLSREMHGHVHNALLNATAVTATALVKAGVAGAAEVDSALLHLSKLMLASGGVSGAYVGVVGNGSEEAYIELASDIALGGPAGVCACFISWTLPAPLAAVARYVLRVCCAFITGSDVSKSLVRRALRWASKETFSLWRAGPGAEAFEKEALRRMSAIGEICSARRRASSPTPDSLGAM